MCLWKPTPVSALLSSLPPGCPLLLQSQSSLFLWVGGGTNYTRRGHIAPANSLSEGVEEDRMEGSTLLVQAFMGSFIYAQPLSLSLSRPRSLNPQSTPSFFPDWIYGWPPSCEHSNRGWKGAHTACTSNTGFYDTPQDQRWKARENSHWANKTNTRKRIPGRFRLRCYCHSQTTSQRAGKAAGERLASLCGKKCPTTGEKSLGALSP